MFPTKPETLLARPKLGSFFPPRHGFHGRNANLGIELRQKQIGFVRAVLSGALSGEWSFIR
jgi:hypothetical protein